MMPIRSRAAAAAVHILTALCAAVGVVLQCGFIGGKLNLAVLQYFTLMSNILCAVYFTGAAVHTLRRGGTWLPVCKGALVMAMAITGITFHLVLAAGDFSMGPTQLITNHLLHTAAPLLTVLDWLLFDEKGRYRWFEPFLWGIFPSAYFVYTMIRARVSSFRFYNGSPYPYAFMDVDALGWGKVLLIFLGMAAAFLAFGYVLVWLDHLLARRRDFTVNALMENVLTGQVLDHFHGLDDLRRGILRHVDSRTFPEDPLRVLRGAQFAARFRFAVAPETVALCRGIDLSALPPERVEGELCKALLQADRPSLFFETLRDMGQLSPWFPEVEALIGVPQDPGFHQEGDVWNHTMLVLDQAAALRSRARRPFAFMLAALTHDLGKTVTTQRVRGRIHAYAHETAGVPLVEALLRRIVGEKAVTAYVLNMVELHMKPNALVGADASVKASNRMFDRSVEPEDLILLAAADGRGTRGRWPWEDTEPWLRQRLALYREIMARPQVTGAELIAAGLTPDSRFRELLDYAHKLHLAGIPHDSALKQTLAYARKRK